MVEHSKTEKNIRFSNVLGPQTPKRWMTIRKPDKNVLFSNGVDHLLSIRVSGFRMVTVYLEENGSCRIFFDAGRSDAFGSSKLSTIALRFSARDDFSSPLPSPLSDGSELPPVIQTMECYATPWQLWRETRILYFFTEPSYPGRDENVSKMARGNYETSSRQML